MYANTVTPDPYNNPSNMMMGNQNFGMNVGMNMQAMGGNMLGNLLGNNNNPRFFSFVGNALSLQSRLGAMSDQSIQNVVDASINITGKQIQTMNTSGYMATVIAGSIIIIPIFFICCSWWKRCVFPAYDVPIQTYSSLARLIKGASLRNLTLTVIDNCFDAQKAAIIYEIVAESRLTGFTFINQAGEYNFTSNQYSHFVQNMRPLKTLNGKMTDIRWGSEIVR